MATMRRFFAALAAAAGLAHAADRGQDEASPPALAGVWRTSSGALLLAAPLGSAFGSVKAQHPTVPQPKPGSGFAFDCMATDLGAGVTPCPWARAYCTLAVGDAVVCTVAGSSGPPQQLRGTVAADGNSLAFAGGSWERFSGEMSGLWCSHYNGCADVYVMAHNRSTDALNVSWDPTFSAPPSRWAFASGRLDRAAMKTTLTMHFPGSARRAETDSAGVAANFSAMDWSSPLGWRKRARQVLPQVNVSKQIKKVHMVFMNHLDVGYTKDINDIDNEYLHMYYGQVRKLALEMEAKPNAHADKFVYITHPWLISLFLDCPCAGSSNCSALSLNSRFAAPLRCPSSEELSNFTDSVRRGHFRWHGAPFNLQAENSAPELFEAGLRMARRYDQQFFGENRTIVASDRDVVYMTRAVIPLLAKYGMRGLTIGSNGGMFPPQTPKLHVWKEFESNTSVIVVYNPYAYGGYTKSTCAGPTGLPETSCGECIEAPNGVAMCSEFRECNSSSLLCVFSEASKKLPVVGVDNLGPPTSVAEIESSLQAVRDEYPGAEVVTSTFDDFIRDVEPVKEQLPVVTAEVSHTIVAGILAVVQISSDDLASRRATLGYMGRLQTR